MRVKLVVGTKAVDATVAFGSRNGNSLMLGFDDAVWVGDAATGTGGLVVGMLPVLRDDAGQWTEILTGGAVTVLFLDEDEDDDGELVRS